MEIWPLEHKCQKQLTQVEAKRRPLGGIPGAEDCIGCFGVSQSQRNEETACVKSSDTHSLRKHLLPSCQR